MSKHIQTVQNIYAAFGTGNIPAILEQLSDDCDWEYSAGTHDVPWLQRRRGRSGAAEFFRAVGTELDIKSFGVASILGNDRLVVALIAIEFVVRRTGKTVSEVDEAHLWHFDDRGRVARFKHAVDTHQHVTAWQR